MTDSATVLEMHGVGKAFPTPRGSVQVLRDVAFALRPGEFVAVTGPSGSGKSTFLNLAGLLDQPSAGRVLIEGRDVSALDEAALSAIRKNCVGMVFQNFHLLPHRSVRENVAFRFRYVDIERGAALDAADRTLAALGLGHLREQPARLLSGGEMQRVAIARAVALRPKLLLADEPTGNLDRDSAHTVMETFRGLNEDGISVILATHNESLLAYCARRFVCRDGRLEEQAA
ncbi:MAG: ABC transporter ATP-binding protein [Kiritimatiellae bacterium]|nr:ABC transporter ATP-binding protein [Kiritimatiellia bacterium]